MNVATPTAESHRNLTCVTDIHCNPCYTHDANIQTHIYEFHMNTPWRDKAWKNSRLRLVVSTEHIICGPAAKWTHLPVVTKFHTKMALTSLVNMKQDGPDKHLAFWAKPVWLCGLAGVTHVFPVLLHLKAFYWTCVYFAGLCVSLNVFVSCLCICSVSADRSLPHKAHSTLMWLTCPLFPILVHCFHIAKQSENTVLQ